METLVALLLVLFGLQEPTSQTAFFIPVPSIFAPVTGFGCPVPGTVFTYDVRAWNTNRPNRMTAIEQDQLSCRIKSDAQGNYDWFGGIGPHLGDEDSAEKKLISGLWPLRVGNSGNATNLPSGFSKIEYVVAGYGLAVVPAGAMWAYRIRKDYYWHDRLVYTTARWWSPSLKWTILQWTEEFGQPSRAGGYNWGLLSVAAK